jgi:hypothetical protein
MKTFFDLVSPKLKIYVLITFIFSWSLWVPSILSTFGILTFYGIFGVLKFIGSFGPSIIAIILTVYYDGFKGLRDILTKCYHYYNFKYLLVSLFLLPFFSIIALFLMRIFEASIFLANFNLESEWGAILGSWFFLFLFGGPLQEEIGWRGYALPYLQEGFTAIDSSVILGGVWTLWHFPLFYIGDSPYFNQFFVSILFNLIVLSVIFTFLYNNTNGSILVAIFFHTSMNFIHFTMMKYFSMFGNIIFSSLISISVVIIIIYYGPKNLKKEKLIFI